MRVTLIPAMFIGALTLGACAKDQSAADSTGASATGDSATSATPQKVGETTGLNVPESVRYDADLDSWFITNVNGNPSMRDNNGFIVRVHADSLSAPTTIAQGGRAGLNLNAPKGMAIQGDTLFVTDIYMLRKFNKRTGEYLGAVSLRDYGATFLNDIAIGPDGIYITDTGIQFDEQGGMTHPGANRVYKVNGLRVTTVLTGDSLMNPNGIAWDATNARFILAPFGGPNLMAWNPGTSTTTTLVAGPGGYDGVEVMANGNILVSSWTDSTVHVVHGGSHIMPLVRGVSAPADIGVDTKRSVLAIPRFNDAKVEYYRIP
ncbi:MAG TPA: SMP-30/gluconolactonase/LRE family protein [Gemmatimonadaceae bacterium]|nr:SMP-30/gluconolactonase/LRE family protein [Gemmatimonadaceae bacterium]